MDKRPLIETNPYLRDPKKFRKALITNVSSSTAVETGAPVESIARTLTEGERVCGTRSHNPIFQDLTLSLGYGNPCSLAHSKRP